MRITRGQLRKIVNEEARRLNEGTFVVEIDVADDERSFVAQAKHAGLKASIVTQSGPGGGFPVVRIEGDDRDTVKRFLLAQYDPDLDDGDIDAFVVQEGTRLAERGRPDFSDLADRTETYDQLVDAFQSAMADTGEDFEGLVSRLRDDVGA